VSIQLDEPNGTDASQGMRLLSDAAVLSSSSSACVMGSMGFDVVAWADAIEQGTQR
jgi:hypothetical protein